MENKKTVLVTGGSGFIASHCIIQLAASGYQVKATVRDLSRTNKLNQTLLNGLEKYEGKSDLSVDWQVTNLSSDEGWDEAMAGCDYVLHVASPIAMQLPKDEDEMVKPAVEGTLRVLKAGLSANVEQFIITSSIVAMFRKPNRTNPYSFGEKDWTDENWKKGVSDYFLSKTKAERIAWEFMESKGLKNKMTTINPGGVFGDALDKKGSTSIEYIRQFLKGKFPAAPKWGVLISDVRDVAKSHVACIGN